MLNIEPGWTGMFTRQQAEGALSNGTRVAKINSENGDGHQDGAEGTILGSIGPADADIQAEFGAEFAYFVEWDDQPKTAVGITSNRVRSV